MSKARGEFVVAGMPALTLGADDGLLIEFPADAKTGQLTRTSVTCTLANTDYEQAIPDSAIGLKMRAVDNDAAFAIGEATTATSGGWLFADETEVRLLEAGENRVLHVQSADAGTVVRVEFF